MTDYIVLAILAVTIGALIGAAWVCHEESRCFYCKKRIKGEYVEIQAFGDLHDVCKCCPDCHHKLMELYYSPDDDDDDL